jgi:co-chaperonin GroES (HSP10)
MSWSSGINESNVIDPAAAGRGILGDGSVGQQQALLPPAEDIKGVLRPTGFKLLVYIPHLESQMKNGLFRTDQNRALEESASLVGQVIDMGPDAYKDTKRFPDGPWCKTGDHIMMRAYSGTRFRRAGYAYEYRLINDDTVEAVVTSVDPAEIERA